MSFEVELTLLIESATAETAEEAVDAVLAAVRRPLVQRRDAEEYTLPASWLSVVHLAPAEDDPATAARAVAAKLGGTGWITADADEVQASLIWDGRSDGDGVLAHPSVHWAHVLASPPPTPADEMPEFEELGPDAPVSPAPPQSPPEQERT
ncbi:MAG: hypothetical protein KY441_10825 [Actinobacteria bacterium]|nr:hypothetical protein [Actinomycetota bacterium]